ncbi:MAG TPA: hypothetical protein DDW65_15975, partial [Firmicutes bacterium]|nr:hypothetical protein [Bacillota bacterium]
MHEQNAVLIRAKLNTPTVTQKIIKREKVLEKLQRVIDYKLTLITAPAGSGKTTAAVSYLTEAGLPFAWLSLDESDNDPVRFWRYILASMRGVGSLSEAFWDVPVSLELIRSNIQADMVLDKLFMLPGDTVMVLDDYHLIDNEIIQSSLAYFIKYLPAHFRMMILSRKEPDLKVIREWMSGRVCKLGGRDLSFDLREIAEFFKVKGYPLTPEEISAIWNYTEGWAAGLVLAVLSMGEEDDAHAAISRFSGKNRHINQIFQDEVFDHWPDGVKDFLVRIAFLDKFCGPLCEAVTGFTDSAEYLKKLSESNSFIVNLDQEDEWFRFHHLFSDFLQQRLAKEDPTLRRELYRRAGEWYRENGLIREAIQAFIKADAYQQAFPLLVRIYLSMAQDGDYDDWLKWMDNIPPEYYEGEVRTCTGYSWLASMKNRTHDAQIWADKAQSCFERIKDGLAVGEKDYLEANVLVAKANLAFFEMDVEQVISYSKQAGRLELSRSIIIGEMNSGEVSLLKTAYGFKGRLKKVDQLGVLLVEGLPRLIGNFSAYLTVGLAECHYERNHLQTASQILNQGMENIIELGNPGAIVPSMITLAKIKRAAGDIEGALRTIDMGRRKLAGKSKTFWNYYL